MMICMRSWIVSVVVMALTVLAAVAQEPEYFQEGEGASAEGASEVRLTWGVEAKTHFRDSEAESAAFVFPSDAPSDLAGRALPIETVDPGSSFEVSLLSLLFTAEWADTVTAHAKVDVIDLYERNPTSGDREVDVDELWLRFGRETEPAVIPERPGYYVKIGKFAHFERQDDRHLESYGLISTAFNRLEDTGLEVGADLGRYLYAKVSLTQGNPLFFRDVNALAGDNGLEDETEDALGSGFHFLYDAEVENLDVDGDLEVGYGLGVRFGSSDGRRTGDFLLWHYERNLAETVPLKGTFYGGDLDLLDGPELDDTGIPFSFLLTSDEKEETGVNLWLYWDQLTFFGQYADQEVAGIERDGWEVELSYRFEFPLRWSLAGRQLFPFLAPTLRYSEMDVGPIGTAISNRPNPAIVLRWDWEKLDYGLRLTVIEGIDITVEYADVTTITPKGGEFELDEFLTTLRWRL